MPIFALSITKSDLPRSDTNGNKMDLNHYTTVALKDNQHLARVLEISAAETACIGYTDGKRDKSLDGYYFNSELTKKAIAKNALVTYEWWGKLYTNGDRLMECYEKGLIDMEEVRHETTSQDQDSYTAYTFKKKSGEVIARIHRYDGWGFSTQATAIELTTVKSL